MLDGLAQFNPEPGSWEHYKQVTAWILSLWTVYRPE